MEQNLLIDSDLSIGNNLDGEYKFLKALEDNADDEFGTNEDTNDDDEFWTIDLEEDDEWWDPSKPYTDGIIKTVLVKML